LPRAFTAKARLRAINLPKYAWFWLLIAALDRKVH
jgi:hypothetical protein